MTVIGTIKELKRYPVKSMRGESLAECFVNYSGLTGDRIYALVNPEKKDNFPWHTAREQHELLLYKPRFLAAPATDKQYPDQQDFRVIVETPEGRSFAVDDPKFLSDLEKKAGTQFFLRFSEKGMQDARPLSLISYDSIEALGNEAGIAALDPDRFRANFYVKWNERRAFFEDTLVDRHLRIGGKLEIRIVKKDPRCKIINLDPKTAELNPAVLLNVAKHHKGCIGVYAAVIREGEVRAGDDIALI